MTKLPTIAKVSGVHGKSPHSSRGVGPCMWIGATLLSAFMMVGCSPRTASLPRDTQTVDGMTIYIGVIPPNWCGALGGAVGPQRAASRYAKEQQLTSRRGGAIR
jgi:hypothetical protein